MYPVDEFPAPPPERFFFAGLLSASSPASLPSLPSSGPDANSPASLSSIYAFVLCFLLFVPPVDLLVLPLALARFPLALPVPAPRVVRDEAAALNSACSCLAYSSSVNAADTAAAFGLTSSLSTSSIRRLLDEGLAAGFALAFAFAFARAL